MAPGRLFGNRIQETPFFKIYGLNFWGIQARMHQSLENVREACTKQGRDVTAKTGMRTKEMRAWRSLGRAMLDIHMLVFNLGRSDFRGRHLRAYAIEVQSSLSTSAPESAVAMGHTMLLAVGSLVEMRGILQFWIVLRATSS